MENLKLNSGFSSSRRKIIELLGLGAIGAMIFRLLPLKRTVAKRFVRRNDEKVSISINEYAVKRSGKVTKHG